MSTSFESPLRADRGRNLAASPVQGRTGDHAQRGPHFASCNVSSPDGVPLDPSPEFLNLDDRSLQAYRRLFSRVQAVLAQDEAQCICLTSLTAGEGKTTTAVNLALVAANHARVLVIDANLTRPNAAERLAAPTQPGLSEILVDGLLPKDAIHFVARAGYSVLPAGRTIRHYAELLAGRLMTLLLWELKEQFDLIILDGPPVAEFDATAALADIADASFLVVQVNQTHRTSADRALAALESTGVLIDGCIFTGADGLVEIEDEETADLQLTVDETANRPDDLTSLDDSRAAADCDDRIKLQLETTVDEALSPSDTTDSTPLEFAGQALAELPLPPELCLTDPNQSLEAISAFDLEPDRRARAFHAALVKLDESKPQDETPCHTTVATEQWEKNIDAIDRPSATPVGAADHDADEMPVVAPPGCTPAANQTTATVPTGESTRQPKSSDDRFRRVQYTRRQALNGLRIGSAGNDPGAPGPAERASDDPKDPWAANVFGICGVLLLVTAVLYLAFDVLMCL